MPISDLLRPRRLAALLGGLAALLAPWRPGQHAPAPPEPGPPPATTREPLPPAVAPPPAPALVSQAATEREYRRDGAGHLYRLNAGRIYQGTLPPLLYAIGTLQVHLDSRGRVTRLSWLRAPRHAPEVVAEIEATVRRAAPFPVAARLGSLVYTDTWLWDKSGRFQLDTLTEGQR